ncbi:MAG: GLUG motif-containing protein [Eubacteriales bacterium]|nr:GLUG motif-containing protein [Eubacteriales bacterium]
MIGSISTGSTVANSYVTGNITGVGSAGAIGGLVGSNAGTITNSYTMGNVTGEGNAIGGLVGMSGGNATASISNSYSTSTVTASTSIYYVGGLVGYIEAFGNIVISNSYSTGKVTGGVLNYAGGLVGYTQSGTITNSYWDTQASGMTTSAGGTGKTTAEMKTVLDATWSTDNWCFSCSGYPVLKGMPAGAPSATACDTACVVCPADATGTYPSCTCSVALKSYSSDTNTCECPADSCATDGSQTVNEDCTCSDVCEEGETWDATNMICVSVCPSGSTLQDGVCKFTAATGKCASGQIAIQNAGELAKIGIDSNYPLSGSYCLTDNIDLATDETLPASHKTSEGWIPIGNTSTPFTGTFDGNDKTISNLTINRAGSDHQGLFGYVSDITAKVQNLGIENINVAGYEYVGGLVGYNNSGIITNSHAAGNIAGYYGVGGLIGFNSAGTVNNSYTIAAVSGSGYQDFDGSIIGGLVGQNEGTITNSYVIGNMTSGVMWTGGLVGWNSGSGAIISNSYVTCQVSGAYDRTGGLAGQNDGTISNSYATGNISSVNQYGSWPYTGGLVGWNEHGTVTNSYATGNVTGGNVVGGLIGYSIGGTMINSYATGSVTGASGVGGLIGQNYNSGTAITNSYWDTQTSGRSVGVGNGSSAGTTGKTTAEMKSIISSSIYVGWSTDNWCFSCSNYPVLKEMPAGAPGATACDTACLVCPIDATLVGSTCECDISAKEYNSGTNICECPSGSCATDGSETTDPDDCTCSSVCTEGETWDSDLAICVSTGGCPTGAELQDGVCKFTAATGKCVSGQIAIQNAGDLAKIGIDSNYPLNGSYCLTANIDLATDETLPSTHSTSAGWIPIGNTSTLFTGILEGNDKTISNLTINRAGSDNQGLFGYSFGSVKNIGLINAHVTGKDAVGGLIGYSGGGSVLSSYISSGFVTGGNAVGGLVGSYSGVLMTLCYSNAAVSGSGIAGGLVGEVGASTITNSYATGEVVSLGNSAGGLIGFDMQGRIDNCYATGDVTGSDAGAFTGTRVTWDEINEATTNCYATGHVTGAYIAGFIGTDGSAGQTVYNSYWDVQTTGQYVAIYGISDTPGGITGKTTAEMQTPSTFSSWDTAIWSLVAGQYPKLIGVGGQ